MPRKTMHVAKLLEMANSYLANSGDDMRHERLGVASFIESILLQANAYKGFGYLPAAGVNLGDEREWANGVARNVTIKDESRRRYYVHHKLTA